MITILSFFNDCSVQELASVPSLSSKKAQTIFKMRPFDSWNDLVREAIISNDIVQCTSNEIMFCISHKTESCFTCKEIVQGKNIYLYMRSKYPFIISFVLSFFFFFFFFL